MPQKIIQQESNWSSANDLEKVNRIMLTLCPAVAVLVPLALWITATFLRKARLVSKVNLVFLALFLYVIGRPQGISFSQFATAWFT